MDYANSLNFYDRILSEYQRKYTLLNELPSRYNTAKSIIKFHETLTMEAIKNLLIINKNDLKSKTLNSKTIYQIKIKVLTLELNTFYNQILILQTKLLLLIIVQIKCIYVITFIVIIFNT